jgi:hypothetical protein
MYFIKLLIESQTYASCLSCNVFVRSFLRAVYEKSVRTPVLAIVKRPWIAVPSTAQLGSLPSILEHHPLVFDVVVEMVKQRPFLASTFQNLLQRFMNQSIDSSLIFLRCVSNIQSGFMLSDRLLRRFVRDISESRDDMLLSLVSGSKIVHKRDMFLVRHPSFLRLVLVATGKNPNSVSEIFSKATPIWSRLCYKAMKTVAPITSSDRNLVAS